MERRKPFKVFETNFEDLPARLDTWLTSKLKGVSRRKVQEILDKGAVLVNGKVASKGRTLFQGDRVEVLQAPSPAIWYALPDPSLQMDILFEDSHVIVVNKPSGMPSVPLGPDELGTLAGAVAARFPECTNIQRRAGDAGLIQRLDTQTSGVAVVARTKESLEALLRSQSNGFIKKTYLALIPQGDRPVPTRISEPLESASKNSGKVKCKEGATPATTEFSVVGKYGDATLVQAVIHQGFRHQIRAHLAHLGHPIYGDELYGGPSMPGLNRLFLHASAVRFVHPVEKTKIEIKAQLPKDLSAFTR